MPKKIITHQEKGRWVLIDLSSDKDNHVVEVIKTIKECEIKIVSGRTYVRFPIRTEKIYPLKRKFADKATHSDKNKEFNNYCAVILKT